MDTPNIQDGNFGGFSKAASRTRKAPDTGADQPIHADYDIFDITEQELRRRYPNSIWNAADERQKWEAINGSSQPKPEAPAPEQQQEGSPFKTNRDLFPNSLMQSIGLENLKPGMNRAVASEAQQREDEQPTAPVLRQTAQRPSLPMRNKARFYGR